VTVNIGFNCLFDCRHSGYSNFESGDENTREASENTYRISDFTLASKLGIKIGTDENVNAKRARLCENDYICLFSVKNKLKMLI